MMQSSLLLMVSTLCGLFACGVAVPTLWNPLTSIENVARPVLVGHKDGAVDAFAGAKEFLSGDIPSAFHHGQSAVGDVIKGDSEGLNNAVMETLLALGLKPSSTVPPQTMKPNKPGLIGSVSSNIEGGEDNLSEANITSSPQNNSPISKIKVLGSNSRAKIGSATSDVSLGGETNDNTDIDSSPVNNSPVSDSEFKNSDATVGSASSNVKLGKGSSKSVSIKSNPVNNSPISGSTFGESK